MTFLERKLYRDLIISIFADCLACILTIVAIRTLSPVFFWPGQYAIDYGTKWIMVYLYISVAILINFSYVMQMFNIMPFLKGKRMGKHDNLIAIFFEFWYLVLVIAALFLTLLGSNNSEFANSYYVYMVFGSIELLILFMSFLRFRKIRHKLNKTSRIK